jgi:hypothetical protein
MTGISNRPQKDEEQRQAQVEAKKSELPDFEAANRARKDHPIDKDREFPPDQAHRLNETGVGRGLEHQGH